MQIPKRGSLKKPLLLNVHTEDEEKRVDEICTKNQWYYRVTRHPFKPREISDLLKALDMWREPKPPIHTGRNDPCPCGSQKKYKKCCWGKDQTYSSPVG